MAQKESEKESELPKEKNLYQKLVEIMAAVQRIPKNGWNDFHKYYYVREGDLVDALKEEFTSRGIMLIPSVRNVKHDIRLKSDGKAEGILTTVGMTFKFIDSSTGESESFDWAGTGDDKGDKGLYKAYTGAEKYFLMKTFLVPTGDDPEADEKTDQRTANSPPKPNDPTISQTIRNIWFGNGGTEEQLQVWIKKNNNNVGLDNLIEDRQISMLKVLEAKQAEKSSQSEKPSKTVEKKK